MNRAAAAAVSILAGSAMAAEPPPISTLDSITGASAPVQPATALSLGSLQVTLEKSTFSDIAEIAPAPPGQHGDAAGFEMWVCFTITGTRQRLWLTSDEIGGHKYINGVVAELIRNGIRATSDCPALPKTYLPAHLDFGVWLGTSINELEKHLGAPTWTQDGALYFAYIGKDSEYDVTNTLIVRLDKGKVVALRALHITTN